MPIIATAGWSIPKPVADRFPPEGSGLQRYASVFDGVEINSTFYRTHRSTTFERWAEAVPDHFRFAVKLPRTISHDLRLSGIEEPFRSFLEAIAPLGHKLGPLLCQLPPSLVFDPAVAEKALAEMRKIHEGPLFIEARHVGWRDPEAVQLLARHGVGRVLADPAIVWSADDFKQPPGYVRLHGKPRIYYSAYSETEIQALARMLAEGSWCVFDNTASGAAANNALTMLAASQSTSPL